jgi:hypothetical protein
VPPPTAELPKLTLLERRVGEAVAALALWRGRAALAEEEAGRLRAELDRAADSEPEPETTAELKRLRAENAALKSRLAQAHRRVGLLLDWLGALEAER